MPSVKKQKSRPSISKRAKIITLVCLGLAVALAFTGLSLRHQDTLRQAQAEAAQFTAAPVEPRDYAPVALWVGDSYTEGTGAGGFVDSYAGVVSRGLGYMPVADAQGGSGFVIDGKANVKTYEAIPARLDNILVAPGLVVIDGGRNDGPADFENEVRPAVQQYLDAVKAKWPEARIAIVVPWLLTTPGEFTALKDLLTAEAARVDATLIDPRGEGWFNGLDLAPLTYEDGIHPSKAGHAVIAERMLEELKAAGLEAGI